MNTQLLGATTRSAQRIILRAVCFLCLVPAATLAQFNSGSDGHDGALAPATNIVIDMADHPDGIYHYTEVNIPAGVTVSFIPNTNNSPVVWLVQSNCAIAGVVSANGQPSPGVFGASGGPAGYRGGNGGLAPGLLPEAGFGPGGGKVTTNLTLAGGNASHGTSGQVGNQYPPGDVYGNGVMLPLIGGSGGGGSSQYYGGGGGGGGAILIAASGNLVLTGVIEARGGDGFTNACPWQGGGGGSGGAIRLIATVLSGSGQIWTHGGAGLEGSCSYCTCRHRNLAGSGRIRLESLSDSFVGATVGVTTRGFTGIILLPTNQTPRLFITGVAGPPIPANPTGALATPDVIIPGQQANPITIEVRCENIPLHSDITVEVKPASGPYVAALGHNDSGTLESSTATVSLNLPRGGGTIQAKAVSGLGGTASLGTGSKNANLCYLQTGLTTDGERFKTVEVTATLGGGQQVVYITESGKRFPLGRKL